MPNSGTRTGTVVPSQLVTNDYATLMFIVDAKDMKGGWQTVNTYADLTQNTWEGVMTIKRTKGMVAVVLSDETDGGAMNVYQMTNSDPTSPVWTKREFGAQTINLNNPQTVSNITARNALTPAANDFVNVVDARVASSITGITSANPGVVTVSSLGDIIENSLITFTSVGGTTELNGNTYMAKNVNVGAGTFEIYATDGVTTTDTTGFGAYTSGGTVQLSSAFASSYVYDGSQWLPVFGIGSVSQAEVAQNTNARHTRNQDTQLLTTGAVIITADSIKSHIDDLSIHRPVLDSGDFQTQPTINTLWDARKVQSEIAAAIASVPGVSIISPAFQSINAQNPNFVINKQYNNNFLWTTNTFSAPFMPTFDISGAIDGATGLIVVDQTGGTGQIKKPSNVLTDTNNVESDAGYVSPTISSAVDNGSGFLRIVTGSAHNLLPGDLINFSSAFVSEVDTVVNATTFDTNRPFDAGEAATITTPGVVINKIIPVFVVGATAITLWNFVKQGSRVLIATSPFD